MIKKILLISAFLTVILLGVGQGSASADTNCGVLTGNEHSYAGLIIGYKAYDSTGTIRNPKPGGDVTAVNSIWPNRSSGGNLIHYTNTNDRRDTINFTPDSISIADVDRCARGGGYYGLTVLGETRNNQDGWQLDCDVSLGAYYQSFKISILAGKYPLGLESGGYWTIDASDHAIDPGKSHTVKAAAGNGWVYKKLTASKQGSLSNPFPYTFVAPPNGYTARLSFVYHEPRHYIVNGSNSVTPTKVLKNGTVTFKHSLRNNGPNTALALDNKYSVVQTLERGGKKINSETKTVVGSTGVRLSPLQGYDKVLQATVPAAAQDGDQLCQTLTYISYHIERNTLENGTYDRLSTKKVCATVSPDDIPNPTFKPYFQVKKGSIIAGCGQGVLAGFFNNVDPLVNNGSGAELGALSNKTITGFATGINSQPNNQKYYSFADNTYTTSPTDPKIGGDFGYYNCSYVAPLTNTVNAPGVVTIDSKIVNDTERIVTDKDVYITGDILYNPSNWTKDNMPSFVLKAKNIYIDSSVSQLDGTYIAEPQNGQGGAIYTCAFGPTPPDTTQLFIGCNKKLTIYGVFVANKINLLRTYGDINNKAKGPAEEFIFSPEIFINGTNTGTNNINGNIYPYDSIYNLPPIL